MSQDKLKIKKFVLALSKENYAEAHKHLKDVLHEKTKRLCSNAYKKISKKTKR